MEAMTNGGLQPVYNVNGDGDGWGGGGSWWAIMLFFLLAWGGGWGGNRNQEALTRADLCQGFNFNNLDSAVRGVQSGLCDGFYAMNTGMLNGFGSVNQNINESRFASQQCCCETNRNIDSVKFENAQNTCEITSAIHSEGEATRALITQNEMQKLRDELADAKLANSQCAQNAYLVNQLQPVAKPAYITCSPYAANQAGCGSCAI
nr:MAG TPA: hypothetical protein [Caudoviricetes sp.]